MKKYLIQKEIEAEPMLQYEAEARMGREVNNDSKEDMGFLTCDMQTLQFDWVHESKFEGKPFDSTYEQMLHLYSRLTWWQTFFRQYTKSNTKMSHDERLQTYLINRHIKAMITSLNKILNINTLKIASK